MQKPEKEIYLVRHGETDYNRLGIVQGQGVNPPLNETGRRQALQFLNRYGCVPFDVVFTSTLLRAQQSVEGFVQKGIPWISSPELNEISWGQFEGQPASDGFRAAYRQLMACWQRGALDVGAPQGESPIAVAQRMLRFRQQLVSTPYRTILVCTHGRAMRILLSVLQDMPLQRMDDFPHHNFTLYVLHYARQRFQIHLFNSRDHLHS